MNSSDSHHYVPRWYQKGFLPEGQEALYYLDLHPTTVTNGSRTYRRKALNVWAPARCFCSDALYSIRFGDEIDDSLERVFFGTIDKNGAAAVRFFSQYNDFHNQVTYALRNIVDYMSAQRFRTPQGLDWLAAHYGLHNRNATLQSVQALFKEHATMWVEGVWEIVRAQAAATKFIISDAPVTFFNKRSVPGGLPHPGAEDFSMAGTRTIFPLSAVACLIITHLQLVRNPWNDPRERRINARTFKPAAGRWTDIQFGRELSDYDLLRINLILKRSAKKYIAASDQRLLYPEEHLQRASWSTLDEDWFLLPNPWKVRFSAGVAAVFNDGRSWAVDEYGRFPSQKDYADEERRSFEFRRAEQGKKEWAKRRLDKPVSKVINQRRHNDISDMMMTEYLQESGLRTE